MIRSWLAAWLAHAGPSLAADADPGGPDPDEAAAPSDGDAAIEVVVFGELLVEQARQEVVEQLRLQGYTDVKRKDGRTIYRHETPWKGEVVLWDDGWMQTKRQKVRIEGREMPWAEKNSPLAWAGCVIWSPLCVRVGGAVISHRKFQAVETAVVGRTHVDVEEWSDRIADLAVDRRLSDLPTSLQALWDHGVPLEDEGAGPPLATPAERRRALFDFWESRTETPWGEEVRRAVEAFARAVVQPSEHPFGAEELAALNGSSRASRPFDPGPSDEGTADP